MDSTCCLGVGKGLLNASIHGEFRAIRGLLSCPDSDVNVVDERGRTPLYLASWLRHVEAVKTLLGDKGINVNIGTKFNGATPFSIASRKGYFEIVKIFIDHKHTMEGKGIWFY